MGFEGSVLSGSPHHFLAGLGGGWVGTSRLWLEPDGVPTEFQMQGSVQAVEHVGHRDGPLGAELQYRRNGRPASQVTEPRSLRSHDPPDGGTLPTCLLGDIHPLYG